MKYCKKCLSTDLRPNASFEDGVCIACVYASSDFVANPNSNLHRLKNKIKDCQRQVRSKGPYDCVIGVSGGKDSTRQAHWVRDRLGLRPLLVCAAYPPKQMSTTGADNLSHLISMGFDLIVATPAPESSRLLVLESFKRFGNVCKSTELSLHSTVPRLAIELGVNMIFWGENPALQVGDSAVQGEDDFDGNNQRNLNTLTEGGLDWLYQVIDKPHILNHYIYPDVDCFEKAKLNIFYLGPAWDDWGLEENACYAALQGLTLKPNTEMETGDLLNASMLDEEFSNINMLIKFYKFGFGRATDLVNEQIRSGVLTREQAIEIVETYDGLCSDEIILSFCDYVGISEHEFWTITKQFVNTEIFEVPKHGRPVRKFTVGVNNGG